MQRFKRTNAIAAGLAGISLLAFSALTAKAQTMPANPVPPRASDMPAKTQPANTKAVTTATPGDMMADKIQGLNVYTLNPDIKAENKVAAPMRDTMGKTVTKDEYTRMTKGYLKVGEIDDIVVSSEGTVKDAVVSVGGFLGVAERNVALGWSDLTFVRTSEGDTFAYIGKSRSELEQLPEFRPSK